LRRDHRPYGLKRLHRALERAWLNHFIAPQLDHLGEHCKVMGPWHFKLYGSGIRLGDCVHVITAADRQVRLTTWEHRDGRGRIDVGDYCLICPGVRIDSACHVEVGSNSMIAAGAYLTDADWHDIYDRTRIIGSHGKVTLEDNVWIGDGAIVCKGVRIGADSVIGAGSVVTRDIPAGVVAAGNPATVIRPLDPERPMVRRSTLLADPGELDLRMDGLDRYMLNGNTWLGWLRSRLRPSRDD
jgi:acetyltransferase-like isoleucine patch superfamily enzyme